MIALVICVGGGSCKLKSVVLVAPDQDDYVTVLIYLGFLNVHIHFKFLLGLEKMRHIKMTDMFKVDVHLILSVFLYACASSIYRLFYIYHTVYSLSKSYLFYIKYCRITFRSVVYFWAQNSMKRFDWNFTSPWRLVRNSPLPIETCLKNPSWGSGPKSYYEV